MKPVRTKTIWLLGVSLAVLVVGLAVALASSRERSRHDLERELDSRATVAAVLIDSILSTSAQSSQQSDRQMFGGARISAADLRAGAAQVPGGGRAIVDDGGRVLAAWPAAAGREVKRMLRSDRAIGGVLDGRASYSVADRGATILLDSGFDTPFGRRAAVTVFPLPIFGMYLDDLLRKVRTSAASHAFIVNSAGKVIGSGTSDFHPSISFATRASGHYRDGGDRYYVAAPIRSTDWRVVLSVPTRDLYAPIGGALSWVGWLLLVGLAAMAFAVIALLLRVRRGAAELSCANDELAIRNEEVMRADRMKSEFLATMSHELRTPLNGIIGFAELMHDGRVGEVSELHREYLADILTSSRHLRRLIDDVLDLSKIEAGRLDFVPTPVDVGEVVRDVRDSLKSLAVRKGVDLTAEVDPGLGTVVNDSHQLTQVLYNFVSNALKFTPERGSVRITASCEGDARFRVAVADDGPGIPAEHLDRVWTPFEQIESGAARRYGGTGLGLALTRRIVEAQGGTVGLVSAPGEGSTFWASWPVEAGAPAPGLAAAGAEA